MARSSTPKTLPEEFRILESLLGTRATPARGEKLSDVSAAAAWLIDQGLLPIDAELSEAEWQRLVELREGLHALLLTPRSKWNEEAALRLNRTIQGAPLELSITVERTVRMTSSARTFDGAFGKIVSFVLSGYFTDQWKRFKTCAHDGCRKIFYDGSKSNARRWCCRRCGEVIRARNHRRSAKYQR